MRVVVYVFRSPKIRIGTRNIVEVLAVGELKNGVYHYRGKVAKTLCILVAEGAYC